MAYLTHLTLMSMLKESPILFILQIRTEIGRPAEAKLQGSKRAYPTTPLGPLLYIYLTEHPTRYCRPSVAGVHGD